MMGQAKQRGSKEDRAAQAIARIEGPMTDHRITFLTFDEAVSAARNSLGAKFVGLNFVSPFEYLDWYVVDVLPDEPDEVFVEHEGSALFDSCSVGDSYELSDAPPEAKNLIFARMSELANGEANLSMMSAEYVLEHVLPGLRPSKEYGPNRARYMQDAGAKFCAYWRKE
jgi:hypothetical protein